MTSAGIDSRFGRRLAPDLEAAGLIGVRSRARRRKIAGGSLESGLFTRMIETTSRTLIAAGVMHPLEVERALRQLADPYHRFVTPTLVAAWGVKTPQLCGSV
jgi:hypothetical protein